MSKIRVVVFDDEPFFRQSMAILLDGKRDMELAGAFENANNLVNDITSSEPDIVLMDLEMPGIDGIEAIKIIRKHFPPLPVVVITQHDEEDHVITAMSAGANGYILKTSTAETITKNIIDVLNNNTLSQFNAHQVLEMFSEYFSLRASDEAALLDKFEKRILTQLVKGKSYKKIAEDLKVDYSTLRTQVKTIYKKLDVSSVSGAVAIAVKNHHILNNHD